MSKRILICDNEKDIVEIITLSLEDERLEVLSSTDPEKLLELIHQNPNLVFLDLHFSRFNSLELIKKIKTNSSWQNIPIILLSGDPNLENIAKESEVYGFIKKPFDITEIRNIVKKIIVNS